MTEKRTSYAEKTKSRGINCYYCGKEFLGWSKVEKSWSDGKDRDVHARCKTRMEKIKAEFSL